jgi:hypothetical protein
VTRELLGPGTMSGIYSDARQPRWVAQAWDVSKWAGLRLEGRWVVTYYPGPEPTGWYHIGTTTTQAEAEAWANELAVTWALS